MDIADRLKGLAKQAEDAAVEHKDQLHEAVQKAETAADQRTQGKYRERIQKAGAKAHALVEKLPEAEPPPDGSESAEADHAPGAG